MKRHVSANVSAIACRRRRDISDSCSLALYGRSSITSSACCRTASLFLHICMYVLYMVPSITPPFSPARVLFIITFVLMFSLARPSPPTLQVMVHSCWCIKINSASVFSAVRFAKPRCLWFRTSTRRMHESENFRRDPNDPAHIT